MNNKAIEDSHLKKINGGLRKAQKHILRANQLVNRFGSSAESDWKCDTNISADFTIPMFHVEKNSIHEVLKDGKPIRKLFEKPAWIPYDRLAVQEDKAEFINRTKKNNLFLWADEFSFFAKEKKFNYKDENYISLFHYLSANLNNPPGLYEQSEKKVKMKKAVKAFLKEHKKIENLLKNTGSYDLVYFTDTDNEWGVRWDTNGIQGKNMLGKIFMEIREEMIKQHPALPDDYTIALEAE